MKLILAAFLFVCNLQAQEVVYQEAIVTNLKDGRTFRNKGTQDKIEKWINSNAPKGDFGRNERRVRVDSLESVEECSEVIDVIPELEGELPYQLCVLPKEYSIQITDVTQTVKDEKAKKDKDASDLAALQIKIKDGSAKLEDVLNYIKIKEGL